MKLPVAAVVKPGTSIENKTGDWRFVRPVVLEEKCNACGICRTFCPEPSITVDEVAVIDYDYCKGCGICAFECKQKAIKIKDEEK